jgi:hypothetical protein
MSFSSGIRLNDESNSGQMVAPADESRHPEKARRPKSEARKKSEFRSSKGAPPISNLEFEISNLYRKAGDSLMQRRQLSKRWQNYQTNPSLGTQLQSSRFKGSKFPKIRNEPNSALGQLFFQTNPFEKLREPVAPEIFQPSTVMTIVPNEPIGSRARQSFRKLRNGSTARQPDGFFTKRTQARNFEGRIPKSETRGAPEMLRPSMFTTIVPNEPTCQESQISGFQISDCLERFKVGRNCETNPMRRVPKFPSAKSAISAVKDRLQLPNEANCGRALLMSRQRLKSL